MTVGLINFRFPEFYDAKCGGVLTQVNFDKDNSLADVRKQKRIVNIYSEQVVFVDFFAPPETTSQISAA